MSRWASTASASRSNVASSTSGGRRRRGARRRRDPRAGRGRSSPGRCPPPTPGPSPASPVVRRRCGSRSRTTVEPVERGPRRGQVVGNVTVAVRGQLRRRRMTVSNGSRPSPSTARPPPSTPAGSSIGGRGAWRRRRRRGAGAGGGARRRRSRPRARSQPRSAATCLEPGSTTRSAPSRSAGCSAKRTWAAWPSRWSSSRFDAYGIAHDGDVGARRAGVGADGGALLVGQLVVAASAATPAHAMPVSSVSRSGPARAATRRRGTG